MTTLRLADPDSIREAADLLRRGRLVAFPTETVYGLGAHALDRDAVRRLFQAKGRPADDPLIVHIGSADAMGPLVRERPALVDRLAARFWPGPLTLVLPRSAAVPDEVTAGLDTVAIRVPAHPVARALLDAAAIPVAAPSANLFSRPSPTRAEHVLQDLDGRIDLVLDGGTTTVGVESTVLDLSQDPPAILRPGAVTLEMLRELVPGVVRRETTATPREAMPSPGLLTKHYSPRTPLVLYEGERGRVIQRIHEDARSALLRGTSVGVLAAEGDALGRDHPAERGKGAWKVVYCGSERDLSTVAARLYDALRELDTAGVDVIFARSFPDDTGLGVAIQDRLRRAAADTIVRC